jgi:hypothetical protein
MHTFTLIILHGYREFTWRSTAFKPQLDCGLVLDRAVGERFETRAKMKRGSQARPKEIERTFARSLLCSKRGAERRLN